MKFRSPAFLSACLKLELQLATTAAAQTEKQFLDQASTQRADQNLKIETNEVVLDVVVRDKKGKPVRDLTAPDFEIYEDGVREQIKSFRLSQPGTGEQAGGPRSAGSSGANDAISQSGYSVQTVTFDAISGKSSMKTATVEAPASDVASLSLSSVAILQHAERLPEANKKIDNPFHFGDALLYPNLNQPVSKSASKQVAYFFDVYPAKGGSTSPRLTVRVLKNGKQLATGSPTLGPVDSSGRIQFAGALPLDALTPGVYDLEITATDEHGSASRSARFTVQP